MNGILINSVNFVPSTLKELTNLKPSSFWGIPRYKTLHEICNGQSEALFYFNVAFSYKVLDYGDDPFESKKWCVFAKNWEEKYCKLADSGYRDAH